MRKLLIFLTIVLVGLSFSRIPAKAQGNDDLAGKIRQNWAFPDCYTLRDSLSFTDSYALSADSAGSLTLEPYSLNGEILKIGKRATTAKISEDGILHLTDAGDGMARDYTACPAAPANRAKAVARIVRYVDRIKRACTISPENDCARVLFKMADDNADDKIAKSELRKSMLTALLLAELSSGAPVTAEMQKSIAQRAASEGRDVADIFFTALDKYKNGSIDYNEAVNMPHDISAPMIKEVLEKSGRLFPAFAVAAKGIKN